MQQTLEHTSKASSRNSARAAAAAILVILGIAFAAIAALSASSAQSSYFDKSVPVQYASVTRDATYFVSVHGGEAALARAGLQASTFSCQYVIKGETELNPLTLTPENSDSKATNAVASFAAPITGQIQLHCASFAGHVYIDDADNSPFDLVGLYVLLCILTLTTGIGLGIAAVRSASHQGPPVTAA